MKMNTLKVIMKQVVVCGLPNQVIDEENTEPVVFFPENVTDGIMQGYSYFGQHFECSLEYVRNCYSVDMSSLTEEQKGLKKEIEGIYDDCILEWVKD